MRKIIYLILCHINFGLERKAKKKQSFSQELAQSSAERAYDAEITGRQPPSGSTAKALQWN